MKIVDSFLRSIFSLKRAKGSISSLILLLILSSCNETKEISSIGYNYYPLKVGNYRIYDVEEIRYLITGFDTSVYQLRETIIDSIPSRDQTTCLLRRDTRQDASEAWESDSLWTVTRTSNFLSITENNTSFVKLTFPVDQGREWNGNSLNSRRVKTYYYQSIQTALIDSINIDNYIRVIIDDIEENVTGADLKSEVYVQGIGLVEKDYLTQKKCTSSDCNANVGQIIAGRSLRQTLIQMGNEE